MQFFIKIYQLTLNYYMFISWPCPRHSTVSRFYMTRKLIKIIYDTNIIINILRQPHSQYRYIVISSIKYMANLAERRKMIDLKLIYKIY